MRAVRKLTVGRRLALLGGVGVIGALVTGGVGLISLSQTRASGAEWAQVAAMDAALTRVDVDWGDIEIANRDALLAEDNDARDQARADLEEAGQNAVADWKVIDDTTLSPSLRTTMDQLHREFDAFYDAVVASFPKVAAAQAGTPEGLRVLEASESVADTFDTHQEKVQEIAASALQKARAKENANVDRARVIVPIVLLVGLALLVAAAAAISRTISRPLRRMSAALRTVAAKDLTVRVEVTNQDEIGEMADALNTALTEIADTLRATGDSASTLAAASDELSTVSTHLGQAAEETAARAGLVSGTAQEVSASVASMSSATEQVGASIHQIAGQASSAAQVASEAVRTAERTSQAVARLDEASQEIGEIVKAITSIAEQTNLLALNATIEAARAGDAGKGFAVVASEVKDLAQETARATEDITSKIAAIQSMTSQATGAIDEISGIIGRINENQAMIAAAVEEQSATTAEISRNVIEVASGAAQIADSVGGIAASTESTSDGATSTRQSAGELSELAVKVNALVGQFRC